MSTFQPVPIDCPHCGHTTERFLATSLNLARAEVHFDAIKAGTFQRYTCPRCAAPYEADRPFLAMNLRPTPPGSFLLTQLPRAWVGDFRSAERDLFALYEQGLGDGAPAPARSIGANNIFLRVTFGLDALREKLLCLAHGLDDLGLELLKLQSLRELADVALDLDDPPRLIAVEDELLTFHWPHGDRESGGSGLLTLERAALEHIVEDLGAWQEAAAIVGGPAFVDLARLWLPAEDAPSVTT